MASYQQSRLDDNSTSGEIESMKPNPDGAELSKQPEREQESTRTASVPEPVHVGAVTAPRSTSPLRSRSPLRSSSPSRTRKFFQEKVQEVVRRARYGQWDFDFSPRSAHSSDDDNSPSLTVPPWGPVSAMEIFTGILRPDHEDPGWKYTRPKSLNHESPRSLPTCAE